MISIGSMLWGTMTPEDVAHDIMDAALESGVNSIDCAQKYPILGDSEYGAAEKIIGRFGRRNELVISTKLYHKVPLHSIKESVEQSLKNLQTDYIDIFYIHEPARGTYAFRQNWKYDPTILEEDILEQQLDVIKELQKEGKIKEIGLSNETAWGITKYGKDVDYVQNEYSLLHRHADLDVAEACVKEGVKFHAWSPLAYGLLAKGHQGERIKRNSDLKGRVNGISTYAATQYAAVAKRHGLSLHHMALAYVINKPFIDGVVIGPRTLEQYKDLELAFNLTIPSDIRNEIEEIYRWYTVPF